MIYNVAVILFIAVSLIMSGCSVPELVKMAGYPPYFDSRSCSCGIIGSKDEVSRATYEALSILGCETITQNLDGSVIIGERQFYIGFFCGQGGETLCISNKQTGVTNTVTVISYKRNPYPLAPRFLHEEFINQMTNVLTENHIFLRTK